MPIEYRRYWLRHEYPPVPFRYGIWTYAHDDYDGPGDRRCGWALTFEQACDEVDELEEEWGSDAD